MSLINDALKRASQTAKDRPSQASLPTPMEPARELARPKSKFIFVGGPLVIVTLALAGWFFLQWFRQRHARAARPPAIASTAATQRPAITPGSLSNPLSQPRLGVNPIAPGQGAPTRIAAVNTPIAGGAASPVSAAVQTPPPQPRAPITSAPSRQIAAPLPLPASAPATAVLQTPRAAQPGIPFPKLEVRGIFYNRSRPYALINGETVTVGERVLGARVVKIQPNVVTVELNGHLKQLVFGE